MTVAKANWSESVVTWKSLVPLLIAMIVAATSLFGYVLSMHAAQPHNGAVTASELNDVRERFDRQEIRNLESLKRIEAKIDKLSDRVLR